MDLEALVNMKQTFGQDIDPEWLELILAAKRLGLTVEEIRDFLMNAAVHSQERAAQ